MPWKLDQPGCSCCGCGRVGDDFSSDTITNYSQDSGTWSIADGSLSTGSAAAALRSLTTGTQAQRLATRFRSAGRRPARLLGGLTSGVGYVYAQVEFDSDGTCGWLELRNLTTGDARLGERRRVENLDPDAWHDLTLCIQPDDALTAAAVYTQLGDSCLYAELEQTPGVGAGLGTGVGGSGDIEFAYFAWDDAKSEDNECPVCDCACEGARDDFERASPQESGEDGIGCLWEVCANFWRVSSGHLVGTADADAQFLVPIDARAKQQFASVACRGAHGTKALLHLGYECGGTATMSAVIEFWSTPGRSKLAVSTDNGATYQNGWRYIDTTGLTGGAGPGFTTLSACLKDGKLYAMAAGERVRASDAGAADAKFAGLGVRYHANGVPATGLREPVFFDSFRIGRAGSPCGGCDAVVGGGGVCSHCAQGAPKHVLVTQPAMTGTCTSCAAHAGNFLLPLRTQEADGETCCVWSHVTSSGCPATGQGGTARLCYDGSDFFLEYTLSATFFETSTESHTWRANLGGGEVDCVAMDETLTLQSTAGGCSAAGTVVRVRGV